MLNLLKKPSCPLFLILLCVFVDVLKAEWYIPELASRSFRAGDGIRVYSNIVNSEQTQLPFVYGYLPFTCAVPTASSDPANAIDAPSLNLGEILRGDRVQATRLKVSVLKNETCTSLCSTMVDLDVFTGSIVSLIQEDYKAEWLLDELPCASLVESNRVKGKMFLLPGFSLGRVLDDGTGVVIYTHLTLNIYYNDDTSSGSGASGDADKGYVIVGFEVVPSSSCGAAAGDDGLGNSSFTIYPGSSKGTVPISYTVSVNWLYEPSITWVTRWDRYMMASDSQVHWYSIINSLVIILILTAMVALVLVRSLHKDIALYNRKDNLNNNMTEMDELGLLREDPMADEVSGWKMVHGDVFRPPRLTKVLVPLIGTGIQLLLSLSGTILFAFFGFLNPSFGGGFFTVFLFLYPFMGLVAGYHSARLFKVLRGNSWKRNAFFTAFTVPAILFGLILIANFFLWGEGSSRAIPFGTLMVLISLWFGVSLPLMYLGSYFGFRKQVIENPVRTHQIPRQIPEQAWFNRSIASLLGGGALPFVVVFIELSYILTSVWQDQFYYMFGFLFLCFVMMIVTSIEISILLTYFQLCAENYRWWWRAFLAPATSGLYVFTYSIFYFYRYLRYVKTASTVLYFSYSLVGSMIFGLVAGTVGFLGTYWLFVHRIYRAVKID